MSSQKFRSYKSLYKSNKENAKDTVWKETYRKRCFERFRASRQNLVARFRMYDEKESFKNETSNSESAEKIVQDVMEIEWNTLNKTRSFPSLIKEVDSLSLSDEESEDFLTREILFGIQQELLEEEEELLRESVDFEGKMFDSQIASFQEEEVICPICKVGKLREVNTLYNNGSLSRDTFTSPSRSASNDEITLMCNCGLMVSKVGLSLSMMKLALQHTVEQHEMNCNSILKFSSSDTNIVVTCCGCDWLTYIP